MPERSATPVPLRPEHASGAARVLADAFAGDPLFRFLCPSDARREAFLRHFQRTVVRLFLSAAEGRVVLDDGVVLGVALVAPPGRSNPPFLDRCRFFLANLLAPPGVRAPLRSFVAGLGLLDEVERHHYPQPHWYLGVLGVSPAAQGRGVGRALLDEVFRLGDADGLPVYLETTHAPNVPLYEHVGFEVLERIEPRKAGPTTWTMLRRPSA